MKRIFKVKFSISLIVILLITYGCTTRLIPDDYFAKDENGFRITGNEEQFNVIKLPEAWYFMLDKWVSEKKEFKRRWPVVVVIDDGFLGVDEFARPLIHGPAYGDQGSAKGVLIGTSLADGNHSDLNCRGYHGTAVAMLLGGTSNNIRQPIIVGAFRTVNIASVAGPWWEVLLNLLR